MGRLAKGLLYSRRLIRSLVERLSIVEEPTLFA